MAYVSISADQALQLDKQLSTGVCQDRLRQSCMYCQSVWGGGGAVEGNMPERNQSFCERIEDHNGYVCAVKDLSYATAQELYSWLMVNVGTRLRPELFRETDYKTLSPQEL